MILAFATVVSVLCFLFIGQNMTPVMEELPAAAADDRKSGFYTILVAGTDTTSNNTDVLMLAGVDTESGKVNVLQLPRDTFVSKSVTGYKSVSRVNGIYAAEYNKFISDGYSQNKAKKLAMEKLVLTLEGAFGVEIDDYVLLNTSAFRSVVDAIGGVWFDVPYDMKYDDPYQDLHIDLDAGYQLLDGAKAEQLVRFRSTPTADIGRTEVRADFIKALAKQTKENLTLPTIIKIAGELMSKVCTSIGVADIPRYAGAVYGISTENINVKTITGTTIAGSPCYYLNKRGALDDINDYINPGKKEITYQEFDSFEMFCDAQNLEAKIYYKGDAIND